jgi:hypothetical protein
MTNSSEYTRYYTDRYTIIFTAREVGIIFDRTDQTIRNYIDEFTEFFTPTAQNLGSKSTRLLLQADLRVISLIVDLKKRKLDADQIRAALKKGERGAIPFD